MMFLYMDFVIKLLVGLTGGSVASANIPKVSIIGLTHSDYTAVRDVELKK